MKSCSTLPLIFTLMSCTLYNYKIFVYSFSFIKYFAKFSSIFTLATFEYTAIRKTFLFNREKNAEFLFWRKVKNGHWQYSKIYIQF